MQYCRDTSYAIQKQPLLKYNSATKYLTKHLFSPISVNLQVRGHGPIEMPQNFYGFLIFLLVLCTLTSLTSLTINKMSSSATKRVLTFVTGNKKKLEEVKAILAAGSTSSSLPFELNNAKIDLPELQGEPEEDY